MGAFKEFLKEQQIDELSKTTIASYVKKSTAQVAHHAAAGAKVPAGHPQGAHATAYHAGRVKKRTAGIKKAVAALKKQPKKKAAKKPLKKGKTHNWTKHGVADNVTHAITRGVGHIVKSVAKKAFGKKDGSV